MSGERCAGAGWGQLIMQLAPIDLNCHIVYQAPVASRKKKEKSILINKYLIIILHTEAGICRAPQIRYTR